jgi:ABC-type glycerol-3-phosphate transport system substrate-binding protein
MSEEYEGPTFEFEGERYPFDPARMSGLEVIALESKTGYTFMEWIEAMEKLRADAVRWLIWVSLTRAGKQPEGKYSEFDYDYVGFLGSLQGMDDETPDPTPARAVRRASKKTSPATAR